MRAFCSLAVATATILSAAIGFSTQASAKCEVTGEIFYMHENDRKKNQAKTEKLVGCDLYFITRGKTRFTSAKIVTQPKNGQLRKFAHLEFRYKPKPGFTGKDEFSLRVCGRTEKGRGCSTLDYDVVVE